MSYINHFNILDTSAKREILTAKIKEEASNLLIINGLDEKGQELQPIFSPHLRNLQTTDANDAIIVKFILGKLYRQFGPVKDRDNQTLQNSINSIPEILAEVSRMLK